MGTEIPLTKGKRLWRRAGTADGLLAQTSDFADAWVEVVVSLEKFDIDLVNKIRVLPEVISLRFDEPSRSLTNNGAIQPREKDGANASELFREFYQRKRKHDPEPQLVALFERLYQEASLDSESGGKAA